MRSEKSYSIQENTERLFEDIKKIENAGEKISNAITLSEFAEWDWEAMHSHPFPEYLAYQARTKGIIRFVLEMNKIISLTKSHGPIRVELLLEKLRNWLQEDYDRV